MPGHKYVLSSRCEVFAQEFSSGVNELGMSTTFFFLKNVSQTYIIFDYLKIGLTLNLTSEIALLRWLYTDKIASDMGRLNTLGLLRAANCRLYYRLANNLFQFQSMKHVLLNFMKLQKGLMPVCLFRNAWNSNRHLLTNHRQVWKWKLIMEEAPIIGISKIWTK